MSDTPQDSQPLSLFQPKFHGTAMGYFRIWIVNMLLTVLTLGIYSAWAKVRTMKYFMGATELDESRFDFHGSPIAILTGRILAIIFFAIYIISGRINPYFAIVGALILFCIIPWIYVKSLRFKLAYTSFKNLRFTFRGKIKDAFALWLKYMGPMVLIWIALTITMIYYGINENLKNKDAAAFAQGGVIPFVGLYLALISYWLFTVHRFVNALFTFIYNNIFYGGQKLSFESTSKEIFKHIFKPFYKYFFLNIAAFIGLAIVSTLLTKMVSKPLGTIILVSGSIAFYIAFICITLLTPYLTIKYVWSRIQVGSYRTKEFYDFKSFLKLSMTNFLAVGFSFGFLYPWAKVRMTKYLVEHRGIEINNFDHFVADSQQRLSAIGEEVADTFDFDIEVGL
ncbi:MAG: DUF898 domain-containing protein [Bdellovibrionaceae bacterium]|jgi:uncharacterized membrane protein YjgN (DUF898 family)|nr:DUF898 domain-containing protein [Pseudobdellovibrionaceae bacterium]